MKVATLTCPRSRVERTKHTLAALFAYSSVLAHCSVRLLFCARFPFLQQARPLRGEWWLLSAGPIQISELSLGTHPRHAHTGPPNLDNQPLRCCDCVTLVKSVSANHHTSRLHKQHAIECSLPSPLTHNPAETTV